MTRIVVVTGGSSGIGRAIAQAFIQNEEKAVIVGRHEDTLQATARSLGCKLSRAAWQARPAVL